MRHAEHGVIARLGALDPAARDPDWQASPDDLMLRRILTSPRDLAAEVDPPRRPRSPMVAASVAALAVVGVGALVWASQPGPAYASWTPEPAAPSAADRWAPNAQCPDVAHQIVTDGDDAQVIEIDLEPVLVDVRGDYTYQLSTDGEGAFAECFITAADDEDFGVITSDSVLGEEDELRPPATGLTILQAGTASWSEGVDGSDGALTAAFGLAAEDIVDVQLRTEAGEEVHATVENGWWAAWAPGESSFEPAIILIGRDGSSQTDQLPSHLDQPGTG